MAHNFGVNLDNWLRTEVIPFMERSVYKYSFLKVNTSEKQVEKYLEKWLQSSKEYNFLTSLIIKSRVEHSALFIGRPAWAFL